MARVPPATALRLAQTWLRQLSEADGRRPFDHSFFWGGFVLLGDPDTRLPASTAPAVRPAIPKPQLTPGVELRPTSADVEGVIAKVEDRFRLDLTDEQAERFFLNLINDTLAAWAPKVTDWVHSIAVARR